jgi:hypothetical protein
MPVPRHVLFLSDSVLRFAYERSDGALYAMRMSNIYSDGTWCSGGIDYNYIDPSSIYKGYFNSIHNCDLSPSDYQEFIEGLVNGTRSMDYDSYRLEPEERWGATQAVIPNPKQIEWSNDQEQGFFRVRDNRYVKIS